MRPIPGGDRIPRKPFVEIYFTCGLNPGPNHRQKSLLRLTGDRFTFAPVADIGVEIDAHLWRMLKSAGRALIMGTCGGSERAIEIR
jgi:hypothetical protein